MQESALSDEAGLVLDQIDLGDWIGAEGEVITSRRGELSLDVTGLTLLKGPAPTPGQVARRWQRPTTRVPPARDRSPGQPREPAGLRDPVPYRGRNARPPDRRAVRRGRDADPPAAGRWRTGAALPHSLERPRRRPHPPDRARALSQTSGGSRVRAGLRDRPQLPQRGDRHPAQPGVHRTRGLPRLRRCQRRDGPHRAAHRGRRRTGHRAPPVHGRRAVDRPHAAMAEASAPRLARGGRGPAPASDRPGRGGPGGLRRASGRLPARMGIGEAHLRALRHRAAPDRRRSGLRPRVPRRGLAAGPAQRGRPVDGRPVPAVRRRPRSSPAACTASSAAMPEEQEERFGREADAVAKGDLEAHPADQAFIRALEYGLPDRRNRHRHRPADHAVGGGRHCIRDRDHLFPLLRPESTA